MPSNRIKITLGGKDDVIDVASFLSIVRETVAFLDHVANASLHWTLGEVSRSSPISVEMFGDQVHSAAPISMLFHSVESLQQRGVRPEGVDDVALKRLSNVTKPLANGIDSVVFSTDDREPVRATLTLAAQIEKVRRPPHYFAYTEIEGVLGLIHVYGSKSEFGVFDPLTDRPTTCQFDPEDAEAIGALIKHRIRVRGMTKFTRAHKPVSVRVDKWEPIENPAPISDLHRAKFRVATGESSEGLIRKLRDLDA